jgi:hypothetical protein
LQYIKSQFLKTIIIINMKVPASFNELTVAQFQEWHEIDKTEKNGLKKSYKILAMLVGKTVEELEDMPVGQIKAALKVAATIHKKPINQKLKHIVFVGFKPYKAILNAKIVHDQLSASQFTAAQTFSKTQDDSIQNMHKLLALMYAPYKMFGRMKLHHDHNYMAEQMKHAKIGDVYGAVFFYSRVWATLQPYLEKYLNQAMETITEVVNEAKAHGVDLQRATAGTTP